MKDKHFGPGNIMRLPDGPGWSPDGGDFWVNGDLLYWNDGSVWDMNDGGVIRTMPGDPIPESEWGKYENYSGWSDEKRSALLAKAKADHDEMMAQDMSYQDEQDALIASAKAKLTTEEYGAVFDSGCGNGRGY